MKLSDIMSGGAYAWMPQVALVIFIAVFFAIVVRILMRPKAEIEQIARLPLDDDPRRPTGSVSGMTARDSRPDKGASR